MKLIIRKIYESEFYFTENLTRETFWNLYKSGCEEHLVLHNLRKSKSYIKELDLIAIHNFLIVGHIISTRALIKNKFGKEHEVLCVGPISVSPALQNKGIGTILIDYSISKARKMGFKGMILFGNSGYYHRFGFKNAKEFKIATKDNQNFEPFMALELIENGLKNVKGLFYDDEAFVINEEQLLEFEKQFPIKEKSKPIFDLRQYT
ncbi:MAG: GNAT family N-acetyltransferase [Bacteroidetes bacterium GWF2_33_16]|nr:MAG: GNAT family N-acetyltransferase [Bacteroidetes bacterium GWE2_32_14]OFY08225.1 MAG: GNAT family N-acetyltransferase [Bacteroidetes bacterium GWF2_33_16]